MKINRPILFILLFFISLSLAIGYSVSTDKTPFLMLTHFYTKGSYIEFHQGELLSGNKVTGEFTAYDNNLGIVGVRFLTQRKVSNDIFVFRLREKGNSKWYYENEYKVKDFGGYPLFPFGFPIISNSKNKEYYFELESLYGKSGRAVVVSLEAPAIEVKHKFEAGQLLNDKKELISFMVKKSKEISEDRGIFLTFITIYLVLLCPFFLLKFINRFALPGSTSAKRISHSVKKLQAQSQIEARWLLWFFLKSKIVLFNIERVFIFILLFVIKKLSSIHKWLGEE